MLRVTPPTSVRAEDGSLVFQLDGADLPEPVPVADVLLSSRTFTASDIVDATTLGRSIIEASSASSIRSQLGVENTALKGQPNGYVPLSNGAVSSGFANSIAGQAIGEAITFAIFGLGD
jgi:hypothetical protein